MNRLRWFKLVCAALMVSACSTSSKVSKGNSASLTDEERRKFDYFFEESLRKKNQGKYDAAFDLMKKAVSIDTANAAGRYELSNYYLQLGRPLVALEYLQGATRQDPSNYWYGMMEAHLLQNLNMSDQAVATYKRLGTIYPNKPEINYSLADVYTQREETVKNKKLVKKK